MGEISTEHYLVLSALVFCVGLFGVFRRKNLLMLFFSTEILLNAANIGFIALSTHFARVEGQIYALFIIAVAASEVAIGLGLVICWYRKKGNLDLDSLSSMWG